ncbi:MAG: pseudouridine synthase [Fusobacteriaceae bacterium]
MRLDKFLVECGVGSRTEVRKIIDSRKIFVNNICQKIYDFNIDSEKDSVIFQDEKLVYKKFRYYILNKKAGYITATKDNSDKTVMELLPSWINLKDLAPVGRLDKDTEGLLLFTNDGQLAHKLLSPKSHVKKTYLVHIKFAIKDSDMEILEAGVDIGGYKTLPASCEKISNKIILLTICEGKFHQVKKMLEAVSNEVTYLKRISFGKILLGDLPLGEAKEISLEDIL